MRLMCSDSKNFARRFRLALCAIPLLGMLLLARTAAADDTHNLPPAPLVYFDMQACLQSLPANDVLRYDALKLVASLQGLANRNEPRLALRFLDADGNNLDDYWLNTQRAGWLQTTTVENENDLAALLQRFPEQVTGLVLWDPNVPATANVAATICGVDGLLPLRAGSPLIAYLSPANVLPPVVTNLSGMFTGAETGSPKCDAYLWAKREYLDKDKCSHTLMANFVDACSQSPGSPGLSYSDLPNATLTNHDFYIARKAFFFDLSPWADEKPVDDPTQPLGTDKQTLIAILQSQYTRNAGTALTSVGGFTPWQWKYSNYAQAGGHHEPVFTEWEYADILTARNAFLDGDAYGSACMVNASAYMHCPLAPHYAQNPRPAKRPLEDMTYVLIYMGDYDSAAWLSKNIPRVWDDPARGTLPIAWAFNPNLAERAPYVFDHVYATKSPNDWFIGGDSGAGYVHPNLLTGNRQGSGLPDALPLWVQHNQRWYGQFDYSITGFVISGFLGDMPLNVQQAYAAFSPDGVGMQLGFANPLVGITPFMRHTTDLPTPQPGNPAATAAAIAAYATPGKPQFLIFRLVLQTPTTIKNVYDALIAGYPAENWEFCDPYTFFDLYRKSTMPVVQVSVNGPGLVEEGNALNFNVAATNLLPPATYQWQYNGTDIPGANSPSLIVPHATILDAGVYSVTVTDAANYVYESATDYVQVFLHGALPVAGAAGLAVLAASLAFLGRARRRK